MRRSDAFRNKIFDKCEPRESKSAWPQRSCIVEANPGQRPRSKLNLTSASAGRATVVRAPRNRNPPINLLAVNADVAVLDASMHLYFSCHSLWRTIVIHQRLEKGPQIHLR